MDEEYMSILQDAMSRFADTVHDQFGQKVLEDVFQPSMECVGRMFHLDEENRKAIAEIRMILDESREIGESAEEDEQ